jgi:histidine triad (HIT) family protein
MAEGECIFCKIAEGGLPASKVYEDENVIAFLDIFPIHPGHVLVVPKKHFVDIFDTPEEVLYDLLSVSKKLAPVVLDVSKADGINIGMNNKTASGQVVMHVHMHVIPRFKDDGLKTWPQGKYDNDEHKEKTAEAMRKALNKT